MNPILFESFVNDGAFDIFDGYSRFAYTQTTSTLYNKQSLRNGYALCIKHLVNFNREK